MSVHRYRPARITNTKDRCEGGRSLDGHFLYRPCWVPGTMREGDRRPARDAPCEECGGSRALADHLLADRTRRGPGLRRALEAIERHNADRGW